MKKRVFIVSKFVALVTTIVALNSSAGFAAPVDLCQNQTSVDSVTVSFCYLDSCKMNTLPTANGKSFSGNSTCKDANGAMITDNFKFSLNEERVKSKIQSITKEFKVLHLYNCNGRFDVDCTR